MEKRFRRRNARGPFRIIRQKQQTFARFVQPPDWRNPRQALGQIRVHGFTAFFVCRSRYHSARFIQREIDLRAVRQRLAVYFDAVFSQVHRRFRIAPHRSIPFHTTRGNQLCRARSRAIAEFRERPRQPYFLHRPLSTLPQELLQAPPLKLSPQIPRTLKLRASPLHTSRPAIPSLLPPST